MYCNQSNILNTPKNNFTIFFFSGSWLGEHEKETILLGVFADNIGAHMRRYGYTDEVIDLSMVIVILVA